MAEVIYYEDDEVTVYRSDYPGGYFLRTVAKPGSTAETRELAQAARARAIANQATLRQWATDAATSYVNWPSLSAAQKDATSRELVRRFGLLADGLADLLQYLAGP